MDEITNSITQIRNYELIHGDRSWTADNINPACVPLIPTLIKFHRITQTSGGRIPQYHTTKKAEKSGEYEVISPRKQEGELVVPSNLFDVIIGLDDVKKLLYRALYATNPVHVFIIGGYASAKSTLLYCLERLPGSLSVDSTLATKSGVGYLLEKHKPAFLLMDEFDKMKNSDDYNVLLTVMASGKYIKTTSKGRINIPMPTRIFAVGNTKNVPESIIARFEPFIVELAEYNRIDALHVMKNILLQKNIEPELASYISQVVVKDMGNRNPRAAINIASTCRTKEDVDEMAEMLMKHKSQNTF